VKTDKKIYRLQKTNSFNFLNREGKLLETVVLKRQIPLINLTKIYMKANSLC